MEKSPRLLSLGSWPVRPVSNSVLNLSPITKRILNQVHVDPLELLPISLQTFLNQQNAQSKGKEQQEEYRGEIERRKKQVSILSDIRTSYILGKDYGISTRKESLFQVKDGLKSRVKSREYQHQLRVQSVRSGSKISRNLSKVTSQKENTLKRKMSRKLTKNNQEHSPSKIRETSEYLVHYDPRPSKNQRRESNPKGDDSTKIQHRKSKAKGREQCQYGFLLSGSSRKESSSKFNVDESRQICSELLKTVEDWEHLDSRHTEELDQMSHLSRRERERLCKMQSLQKKAMGVRMRSIKLRLKSEPGDSR